MKLLLIVFVAIKAISQPIIIDHSYIEPENIPIEWINAAKSDLKIAYGHTSHGSQIISGMDALESFYSDGRFDFASNETEGKLFLFEGSGYSNGYMDHDCGYSGWSDKTRTYLDKYPETNVIIWSWCGQVNNVDLYEHYLLPMANLELEYPDVKFVYMTGHLEGLGLDGSLKKANDQIRNYCIENSKILYDFADIEKYSPDADINYQQFNADDECNYNNSNGTTGNWAQEWLDNNPTHILSKISEQCSYCAHSQGLNCVKKGIAAWYLWVSLAGWDYITNVMETNNIISIYPNPAVDYIEITINKPSCPDFVGAEGSEIEIYDVLGNVAWNSKSVPSKTLHRSVSTNERIDISHLPKGFYFIRIGDEVKKFVKL